jgi:hypothetical protein
MPWSLKIISKMPLIRVGPEIDEQGHLKSAKRIPPGRVGTIFVPTRN